MSDVISSAPYAGQSAAASEQDVLIVRCLSGDEIAYVSVYNLYAGMIYRLCHSLLQNREDAEEVLQDTFEYAFRRLERFDSNKASFKTWLYQIAISRCRNKRRRKWLQTLPLSQALGEKVLDEDARSPAIEVDLNEQQQTIWQALGRLSPKLRETTVLRYYEGLTYVEIGKVLGIPSKTAESRMRLSHKALRQLLSDEFGFSQKDQKE